MSAPVLVLGLWGYWYVRACLMILAAPGRPVVFHYKAQAGIVSVQADSYNVNLRYGRVSVYHPRIVDPKGGLVAEAKIATVTRLDWRKLASQQIDITIDHLSGKLVRFPNRVFALESLIPPKSTTPTQIAFHILVKTANVELVDTAGRGWSQAAYTPLAEISGFASNWIAHGQVSLPGMGVGRASVQYVPREGIHILGTTLGLRADLALNHFLNTDLAKKYSTLRGLSAAKVTIKGAFQLYLRSKRAPEFSVQSNIAAGQVSYGRYTFQHLDFNGLVTSKGAQGTAVIKTPGFDATYKGIASWSPREAASGSVNLAVSRPSSLPKFARALIPKGLSFQGVRFDGRLGYRKAELFQAQGEVQAVRLWEGPYAATSVRVDLNGDLNRIRATWLSGSVLGAKPFGAANLDLRHQTVEAWVRADVPTLNQIAQIAKLKGLSGSGEAQAFVSGPIRRPHAQFLVTGQASYKSGADAKIGPETIDLAGSFDQGAVAISRGLIQGDSGTVAISGLIHPQGSQIAMHIDARDLSPGDAIADFDGGVDGMADLSGTISDPRIQGHLESTDLSYQDHPIIAASLDFSGTRHEIVATNVSAISGTMDLTGAASCDLSTKRLSGGLKLTGIQATDFLGPNFAGIVNVPEIQVGGTVKQPNFIALVKSKEIVAEDVVLASLEAHVRGSLSNVILDHATAALAGGTVSANGTYAVSSKSGFLSAVANGLDLERLAPALGERVSITGTTSITEAKATIQGKTVAGTARGSLDKVTVNGAPVGDGNWTANADGNVLHGVLSIGQILPEIRVLNVDASYDLEDKSVSGTVDADNARIQDLLGAASRYLPASLTADPANLSSLAGDLTFDAKVSGSLDDPDVVLSTFKADNLAFRSEPLGALTASGISRKAGLWVVPSLLLSGPEGEITTKGNLQEHGQIAITASGKGLKLSSLSPLVDTFASSSGLANFELKASGQTQQPFLQGDAELTHIFKAPGVLETGSTKLEDLSITLPSIAISDAKADAAGTFAYAGFTGKFSASVPMTYHNGLGTGSAQASITLDQRSLGELPLIAEYLDPSRTSDATFGGTITASGPVDKLIFAGGLQLQAKSFGVAIPGSNPFIKRVDDSLQDVKASLQLTADRKVQFDGQATLSRGGTLTASASSPLIDLGQVFHGHLETLQDQLLDSPLSGSFTVKEAKFRQAAIGGYVAAQVGGSTSLGGTVGKPIIRTREKPGQFTITDLDTALPTLPSVAGIGAEPTIDPSFNIEAALSNEAHIRSATADLRVTGSGNLRGKLSDPRAAANLVVQKGTIVLPGGTVRLDQGGTVDFGYRHHFGELPTASLDVDLGGHTSVTAIGYGRNAQHYNVTLDIRGDLLKAQGLTMQATSDPPDLPSGDVLALLGASDVFANSGANTSSQTDAEKRITEALAGFAVPAVLNPYTSRLAENLGFDYFSLEYNAFDQTTFSVARAFGSEFSLQYRGQIGSQTPGLKAIQDLRLVYTPRRLPGRLRHLSFSVGTNQDYPWLFAIEYGIRFDQPTGRSRGQKTILFAPDRNAGPSGSSKLPVGPGG